MKLVTYIPTKRQAYNERQWVLAECYRHYVSVRRSCCTITQRLDLYLRSPLCMDCAVSSIVRYDVPDIRANSWQEDIEWELGEHTLATVLANLANDSEFAFHCSRCSSRLRPWDGDDLCVSVAHFEESFGIATDTPTKRWPGGAMRDTVLDLYDHQCFGCGAKSDLHIDHIQPRAAGGDAAFRNLQPLCTTCGQKKGSTIAEDVSVFDDLHFVGAPSDGYEGLFWQASYPMLRRAVSWAVSRGGGVGETGESAASDAQFPS